MKCDTCTKDILDKGHNIGELTPHMLCEDCKKEFDNEYKPIIDEIMEGI